MASTCRGCGQPMRWARNESTGKNIPLDPEPVPDGNLVMSQDPRPGGPFVVKMLRKGDPDPDPTMPRYRPHFATCPKADEFRKAEA